MLSIYSGLFQERCSIEKEHEAETYHSSGRVDDLHLLEDRGTVVSDEHFALGGLDL